MSSPQLTDIFPFLGPWFSIPELSTFGAMSRSMHTASKQACLVRLRSHLVPWLPDPSLCDRLLEVMKETGTIIGGTVVVRYLLEDEDQWIPESLDLFCPASSDRARKALRRFIEDKAGGHSYESELNRPEHPRDIGVEGEVAYMMWKDDFCLGKIIRIFLTSSDNPQTIIPWFWNTLLASYISSSSIVVAYPRTTFSRVGLTPFVDPITLPHPRVLIRTARRGFFNKAMSRYPHLDSVDTLPSPYYSTALRSFSDSATFSIRWSSDAANDLRLRNAHGQYIKLVGSMPIAWQYDSVANDMAPAKNHGAAIPGCFYRA